MSSTKLNKPGSTQSILKDFSTVMFQGQSDNESYIPFLREKIINLEDEEYHLVPVCLGRSHTKLLPRLYGEQIETSPRKISVITTSNPDRSPVKEEIKNEGDFDINMKYFSQIYELSDLGNSISKAVQHYHHLGYESIVAFDSISSLLDNFYLKEVYKFVNILNSRLRDSDAFAAYNLLANMHENHTLSTLQALFDAVINPQADGSVKVSEYVTRQFQI
jgi:hypothetical protein